MSYSCTSNTLGMPPKKRRREMMFYGHCDRRVPKSTFYLHHSSRKLSLQGCPKLEIQSLQYIAQESTLISVQTSEHCCRLPIASLPGSLHSCKLKA